MSLSKCTMHCDKSCIWLRGMQLLLLNVGLSGGNDVVDVGGHKGLDLHILLLLQQLLQHLHVAVLRVLHQHQVSCQAFLHSTLGVQADPLKVGANLGNEIEPFLSL